MKKFENPEMEIEKYLIADVITTSNDDEDWSGTGTGNDTGWN